MEPTTLVLLETQERFLLTHENYITAKAEEELSYA